MKQKGKSRVFWLSLFTTVGVFIVNTAGFVDTMTGSATGCGKSWPLCNDSLFPTWDIHAIIEYGHRFLVFMVSVLLLTLSVLAWRKYGSNRKVRISILLAILGVVLESILGALSVFFLDEPAILAFHMGVALLSFSALLNLTVIIRQMEGSSRLPRIQANQTFTRLIWVTLVYLYLAIYFGAYVARSGAGVDFRGLLFPMERNVPASFYIDIAHRSIALGLVLLIVTLFVLARRMREARPELYAGSIWSLGLVLLQAVSGSLLVYTHLSIGALLLHVSFVSLLFGILSVMGVQALSKTETAEKVKVTSHPLHIA